MTYFRVSFLTTLFAAIVIGTAALAFGGVDSAHAGKWSRFFEQVSENATPVNPSRLPTAVRDDLLEIQHLAEQRRLQQQADEARLAEHRRMEQQQADEARLAEQRRMEQQQADEARLAEQRRMEQQQADEARLAEQRRMEQQQADEARLAEQRRMEQQQSEQAQTSDTTPSDQHPAGSRVASVANSVDEFLGGAGSIRRSDEDAFVVVGANGNRFRIDFNDPTDLPHAHLEVQSPSGRYVDAPSTPHRNYFRADDE